MTLTREDVTRTLHVSAQSPSSDMIQSHRHNPSDVTTVPRLGGHTRNRTDTPIASSPPNKARFQPTRPPQAPKIKKIIPKPNTYAGGWCGVGGLGPLKKKNPLTARKAKRNLKPADLVLFVSSQRRMMANGLGRNAQ